MRITWISSIRIMDSLRILKLNYLNDDDCMLKWRLLTALSEKSILKSIPAISNQRE